jgi:hypothetical protein
MMEGNTARKAGRGGGAGGPELEPELDPELGPEFGPELESVPGPPVFAFMRNRMS